MTGCGFGSASPVALPYGDVMVGLQEDGMVTTHWAHHNNSMRTSLDLRKKHTKMGKINTLDLLIYDFYIFLWHSKGLFLLDIRPVDRTRMDADPASGGVRGHCMGGFSAESWMMWMVVSTFDVPVLLYAVYPV